MRDVGGDGVDGASFHVVLFAADDHFHFAFDDIGDLFMNVVVFG